MKEKSKFQVLLVEADMVTAPNDVIETLEYVAERLLGHPRKYAVAPGLHPGSKSPKSKFEAVPVYVPFKYTIPLRLVYLILPGHISTQMTYNLGLPSS